MHKLTFYPLGNADCCLIELAGGRKVLFDFADVRAEGDPEDLRIRLSEEVRKAVKEQGENPYFDAVAFTHLDNDHICKSSEFFYLEHAKKYQGEGRVKINELWVPAAAVIEEGCTDEDRIIRAEARYRVRAGKGIRVFSRPAKLKEWLEGEGLTIESRQHLITDAGQTIPGFTVQGEGVEFFVHSPFAMRQNETEVVDRNVDSLVVQATFVVNETATRVLFGSDLDHGAISDIVNITKAKKREQRLESDVIKLWHHCSYTASHTFDVAYDLPAEEKLETISSSKLLPAQRFGERHPTVVEEPMSSRPDFVCKSFPSRQLSPQAFKMAKIDLVISGTLRWRSAPDEAGS